jgi:hypothetical protein
MDSEKPEKFIRLDKRRTQVKSHEITIVWRRSMAGKGLLVSSCSPGRTEDLQILFYANSGLPKDGGTDGNYVSLYLACEVSVTNHH